MSVLHKLIVASAVAALSCAPALSAEQLAKSGTATQVADLTAQEHCVGWGVRCEPEVLPEFCIADGKCATALPGSAMLRYAERMGAIAGH